MTRLKREVRRLTTTPAQHGIRPDIIVALYPAHGPHGPRIGLKELGRGRASEVTADVGGLYARLVTEQALRLVRVKRAHRKHRSGPVQGCSLCEGRGR